MPAQTTSTHLHLPRSSHSNGTTSTKHRHRISLNYNLLNSENSPRETREEAARCAKREIRANLREDWKWPPTPASTKRKINRVETSTQWRERDADSSSPPSPMSSPASDPYKFDNPDSIASAMHNRKRKRRRLLTSEMSWNPGLKTFIQRRDAWTGGVTINIPPTSTVSQDQSPFSQSAEYDPPNPACYTELDHEHYSHFNTDGSSNGHCSRSSTDTVELTPLPPPLISPSNPIRSSITPSTYPSIYHRVILENVTPTVPINLLDVTRALVAGWKEEDEWPPKPESILDPLVGKRRVHKHALDGMLDDGMGSGSMGGLATSNGSLNGSGHGEGEKLGLAKRGMGRMKKALGLRNSGDMSSFGREIENSSPVSKDDMA